MFYIRKHGCIIIKVQVRKTRINQCSDRRWGCSMISGTPDFDIGWVKRYIFLDRPSNKLHVSYLLTTYIRLRTDETTVKMTVLKPSKVYYFKTFLKRQKLDRNFIQSISSTFPWTVNFSFSRLISLDQSGTKHLTQSLIEPPYVFYIKIFHSDSLLFCIG